MNILKATLAPCISCLKDALLSEVTAEPLRRPLRAKGEHRFGHTVLA